MKPIVTSLLILATSLVAQARIIQHWPDQELLEKSDLVVIAIPTSSSDTKERTDLPGFLAQKVIGIETGFAVSAIVKGDKELKNFVLHHYRADEERTGIISNGPSLIAFKPEEKRKFLLYLKRETDGRYAPTVGQVDPGMQGITALSEPVSAAPNPTTPTDVAIPTPPSSLALKEPNILAAGDWSEPVAGSRDKNTTRGAHSPVIRGRLLLCVSPKNNSPAVYVELQDCGNGWVTTTEIYCDMGRGIGLGLTDTNGQPLAPKPSEFLGGGGGGGMPGADWITFPADSTIRLRVSPYASFTYHSTDDYLMSGSFVVDNPPADHTGLGVWQGTLKLPAMKIVVPKTTDTADGTGKTSDEPASSSNGEKPDPIDQLVAKLSDTHNPGKWMNGGFPVIHLPETATPEQILEQVFKFTGFDKGHVKDFKILQSRNVQITGGSYTAAEVQTDLGKKVVLFTAGGIWSRVYDANEPANAEAPLSKAAQAVLDGLNQKAADQTWQRTIDMIERPETRPENQKEAGEVPAYLASTKKRLAELGVCVKWNHEKKVYEVGVMPPADGDHARWVEQCLKDFEVIKVGMTRGEIEGKLSKDGGLQSVSPFRFTHPACPSFKIDVEFDFKRDPADQNRALWGQDDKAVKVSKPYIERPACD